MKSAKEIMEAANKVVDYAKSLGFTEAGVAYWDKDNPEYGYSSIGELTEDACDSMRVDLGVYLRNPPISIDPKYDEQKDECSWEINP